MDETRLNGHKPPDDEAPGGHNPYADAVAGRRPSELVEFELHTDPYANMLPRVSSMTQPGTVPLTPDDDILPARRRRNPILVIVSVLLVAILVLPAMAEVFARLFH